MVNVLITILGQLLTGSFLLWCIVTKKIQRTWSYAIFITLGLISFFIYYPLLPTHIDHWSIPSVSQILIYGIATVVICISLCILKKYYLKSRSIHSSNRYKVLIVLIYGFFSAPLQEFVFREYLLTLFEVFNILHLIPYVLFSSTLFAAIHLVFRKKYIWLGTFILGVVWGSLYYFLPNMYLVILSHLIVGVVAILAGLVEDSLLLPRKSSRLV